MDGSEEAKSLIDLIRKKIKDDPEGAIILLNPLEDTLASILKSFKNFIELAGPLSEIVKRAEEILKEANIAEAAEEAENQEKH